MREFRKQQPTTIITPQMCASHIITTIRLTTGIGKWTGMIMISLYFMVYEHTHTQTYRYLNVCEFISILPMRVSWYNILWARLCPKCLQMMAGANASSSISKCTIPSNLHIRTHYIYTDFLTTILKILICTCLHKNIHNTLRLLVEL